MNLREQVEADFNYARRKAFLRRSVARLRRDATLATPPCFGEASKRLGAVGGVRLGRREVLSADIVGSVGRCTDFDGAFLPVKESVGERWKRIDLAFHRGEEFPPVTLYKIGDAYFALDGNHRVSVYRYHGVEWVDAVVTEFPAGSWSERGGKDNPIEPAKGVPKVREMMNLQVWKQRHKEMAREAEQHRLAKALRDSRRRRSSSRASFLAWELRRIAGRLRKRLRPSKKFD